MRLASLLTIDRVSGLTKKSIMQCSDISHELIADYVRTCYQVGGTNSADPINLRINQYSAPMFHLLAEQNVSSAAIITAFNPLSQIQSDEKNRAAHEMLLETVQHYSTLIINSMNIDPSGIWPDEKSLCTLGLSLELARSIGQHFNQNAIIWINSDAVPGLILLR